MTSPPTTRTADAPDHPGARVDALLGLAPHRVVAAEVGREVLRAELAACAEEIARIALADPLIVPRRLGGLFTGGKRLRPLLVLAVAHAARPGPQPVGRRRAVRAAVAVELLHLASLVHDDVMDGAGLRHGVTTMNACSGNTQAVLAGDYLVGRSLAEAAALGGAEGVLAAETLVRLCAGQAEECAARMDTGRTLDAYYSAIAGKTGALFEAAARLGARSVGLPSCGEAALAEYGLHLGIGYQLLDDLLDVSATAAELGKPTGQDIAAGVYTLPVLHALRRRPDLRAVLHTPDRPAAAARALRILHETDAGSATLAAIRLRHSRATAALTRTGLPPAEQAMLAALAAAVLRLA
jgi:heptaprenyl diphosphate synthase